MPYQVEPIRLHPASVVQIHVVKLHANLQVVAHTSRTHLSLSKDAPEPRSVHPVECGAVVAIPQVGGLHHRYERRAA